MMSAPIAGKKVNAHSSKCIHLSLHMSGILDIEDVCKWCHHEPRKHHFRGDEAQELATC